MVAIAIVMTACGKSADHLQPTSVARYTTKYINQYTNYGSISEELLILDITIA